MSKDMEKCKQCCKYDPTGQTECNFCDFQEIYIERSKINKAIEEIKALSPTPTAEDIADGNPIKDAIWENLIDVLEILKRNIGEQN